MHELTMSQSIIEIVEAHARKHHFDCVTKIKIQIGQFTGVDKEALELSFATVKRSTLAHDAELEVEIIPLLKRCEICGRTFDSGGNLGLICPDCKAPVEIVRGREMRIEYIDLE
jgi:hydrogenase nickel incorporation protein HypA/HybF